MTTLTGQEAHSLDICPPCQHRVDAHRGHGCTWCPCNNNHEDARNAAVVRIVDARVDARVLAVLTAGAASDDTKRTTRGGDQ